MTSAPCPVAGCTKPQPAGMFLCRQHWFGTPKPLRDEIWRTWKSYQNTKSPPETRLAALLEYRAARSAVLEYWNP